MKRIFKPVLAVVIIFIFTSCASIVSSSSWPLTVKSNPAGASVQITNRSGFTVFTGQTPATVLLRSGAGFFSSESYKLKLTLDGYAEKTIPVNCNLNGWYFGNILIGGLIGMLIVDPATGAMYRLETSYVEETLTANTLTKKEKELKIMNIKDISQDMRNHLVCIK
jgi:hypothetical protein